MKIENAKIESTTLGYESHGILSAYLHLNFGGSGQGFGGYRLDSPGGPHKACGAFIAGVLLTVGVGEWERLPGTPVRIRRDANDDRIDAIGHFLEDKWFCPREALI